ncbi:hypothetical protein MEQ_04360 [Candida albicans P87]|nr:hypothetical protein MEQ_04360 [Candida albicans P87]KGU23088.1 hypothetical protein MG7_04381 [Candida albicans P34048]KHC34789.1 hypothetical protein W5O_04429 [Candida albicans Ca6]KHC51279.1 hypothetical protein MGC_04388 [Candida albicans P37039]
MRLMEKVSSTAIYDTTRKKNIQIVLKHIMNGNSSSSRKSKLSPIRTFRGAEFMTQNETKCPKVVDYSSQRLPLGENPTSIFDDNSYNRDSDPKTRLTTKK